MGLYAQRQKRAMRRYRFELMALFALYGIALVIAASAEPGWAKTAARAMALASLWSLPFVFWRYYRNLDELLKTNCLLAAAWAGLLCGLVQMSYTLLDEYLPAFEPWYGWCLFMWLYALLWPIIHHFRTGGGSLAQSDR